MPRNEPTDPLPLEAGKAVNATSDVRSALEVSKDPPTQNSEEARILSHAWQSDGGFSNYEHGGAMDDKGRPVPGRKPVGDIRATYMYPVVMKRYAMLKRGVPFEVQAT